MPADPYSLDLAAVQTDQAMRNDEVPADQWENAQSFMTAYNDRVKSEGRAPFSAYMEQRAKDGERVRNYYVKPDNGLSQEQRDGLNELTRFAPDAEGEQKGYFNKNYFEAAYGLDSQTANEKLPLLRADYARRVMGKDDATDSEVFDHIKGTLEIQDKLATAAKDSVLTNESGLNAFQKFAKENEAATGFDPRDTKVFRDQFEQARSEFNMRLAPYRGVVTATVNDLEREYNTTGADNANPTGALSSRILNIAQRIKDVPPADRDFVLNTIADTAQLHGVDPKGVFQKLGETLARGTTNVAEGAIQGARNFNAAIVSNALDELTPSQRAQIPKEPPQVAGSDLFEIAAKLRSVAEQRLDPVQGKNWFTRGLYSTAESLPFMATMMVPYVGPAVAMEAMASDNYNKLVQDNPDMNRDKAWGIANTAAVPQALLMSVNAKFLAGKMPTLAALMNKSVSGIGPSAMRAGVRFGEQFLTMEGTMNAQNVAPAFFHDLANSMDADSGGRIKLDNTFKQLNEQFKGQAAGDLATSIAMMAIVGAGVGTWSDVQGFRAMASSEALVRPMVESDAQASEIRQLAIKGDMDGASKLFNKYASKNLRAGVTIDEGARKGFEEFRAGEARKQAARNQLITADVDAPVLRRTEAGWALKFNDGTDAAYDTHEEASNALWTHAYERYGLQPVELVRGIFERGQRAEMQPGDEWKASLNMMSLNTEDKAMMAKEGYSDQAEALKLREQQSKVLMSGKTIEDEHTQALATVDAIAGSEGDAQAGRLILGTNITDFKEGVMHVQTRMYGGGDEVAPLTALEETAETSAKRILNNEGGREWMLKALREYESVTGDKLFRTKDDADLQQSDFVEAFSHLAVGAFVGDATKPHTPATEQVWHKQIRDMANLHVAAPLNAIAQKWQAAMRRAEAISKAVEEGKMKDDLHAAIAKAAGLSEQHTHEQGVVKEAKKIADKAGKTTFSTLTGTLGRHGGWITPDGAMVPVDSTYGHADKIEELAHVTIKTPEDYGKAYAKKFVRVVNDRKGIYATYDGKLSPRHVAALEWAGIESGKNVYHDLGSRTEQLYSVPAEFTFATGKPIDEQLGAMFTPFHVSPELRRKLGLEMQKRAVEMGREWQDASNAFLSPAQEAQEKAIEDRQTAEITAARETRNMEVADARTQKADPQTIQQLQATWREKIARLQDQHAQELQDTAQSQERQATRASMLAAIRTLDAITTALPPEVRSKVGGYAKLAELQTDAARVKFIQDRVEKINGLLERHLQKEIGGQMSDLIDKSEPSGGPGERAGGKITVAGHRWFKLVSDAVDLEPADVRAKMDALEVAMSEPDVTDAAQQAMLEKWGVLQGYGAFHEKTAAQMSSAFDNAQEIYKSGREAWDAVLADRSAERAAFRETGISEIGKSTTARARQDARADEVAAGQFGKLSNFLGNAHLSWDARLRRIFGAGKTAARYEKLVHNAFDKKTARMIKARREWRDAMLSIFGVKSWAEASDKLLELQQTQDKTGIMKLEGKRTETQAYPVEIAKRIIDGDMSASAVPLSKGDLKKLRDAYEANELVRADPDAKVSRRAKDVLKLDVTSAEGTESEQRMSQLQAVHFTMLTAQENYRKAMDFHGWTDDTLKQMEGFLSPEAKAVRKWLFGCYDSGYEDINKTFKGMFGVDLPKVENYAPGYFETNATPTEMDPFATGMDASGLAAGFLKGRKSHNAEPVMKDALQAYWQHTMQTEHWIQFAPVISELRSVMGNKDVRKAIETKGGKAASSQVNSWIDKFEKNGVRDAQTNDWLPRFLHASTRAGLAYKVTTWMKHLPNALASLSDVPAMEFMRGLGNVLTGNADASLAHVWNSDLIRNRIELSYTPDLKQMMQGETARPSTVGDFMDWGVARIPWIANAFTTFSAAIARDYHFRQAMEEVKAGRMTEAQAGQFADEQAALTVARTAPPESMDRKSLAELDRQGIGKLMMLFHTPERQQWGVAFEALTSLYKDGTMTKGEAVRKLVSTWIVAPVIMQTMTGLGMYLFTDKDAEEAWNWKRYAGAMALGPLSGMFGLGQIAEAAAHHFLGTSGSKAGNPFDQAATQVFSAGSDLFKWIEGMGQFESKDIGELASSASTILSAMTDAPVEIGSVAWNLLRQAFGLAGTAKSLATEGAKPPGK